MAPSRTTLHIASYAAAVAILALILAAVALVAEGPSKARRGQTAASNASPDYLGQARTTGPMIVKVHLRHPLDATFMETRAVPGSEPGLWVAGGYVKAPNGFGNPITAEWAVVFTEHGDRLRVLAVQLDGKIVYADKAVK